MLKRRIDKLMYKNIFKNIPDSWETIVKHIMFYGQINNTEYGNRTKFINGISFEIEDTSKKWHKQDQFCSNNTINEYINQFKRDYMQKRITNAKTEKDKELVQFKYLYIDRLTKYPKISSSRLDFIDQLDFLAKELKKGRFESRRLQAITWIPELDCNEENKEPPCLQRIWIYPYPNKTLDIHINYRSWDIFNAYEANLNAIIWMIQEELLEPTGFKIASFKCFGDNCHIYEHNWTEALKV